MEHNNTIKIALYMSDKGFISAKELFLQSKFTLGQCKKSFDKMSKLECIQIEEKKRGREKLIKVLNVTLNKEKTKKCKLWRLAIFGESL